MSKEHIPKDILPLMLLVTAVLGIVVSVYVSSRNSIKRCESPNCLANTAWLYYQKQGKDVGFTAKYSDIDKGCYRKGPYAGGSKPITCEAAVNKYITDISDPKKILEGLKKLATTATSQRLLPLKDNGLKISYNGGPNGSFAGTNLSYYSGCALNTHYYGDNWFYNLECQIDVIQIPSGFHEKPDPYWSPATPTPTK